MLISATSNKFITWPVMSTPETKTYPINFQRGTNEVNSQHLYSTHWIHCNTLLQHFAFLWRQNRISRNVNISPEIRPRGSGWHPTLLIFIPTHKQYRENAFSIHYIWLPAWSSQKHFRFMKLRLHYERQNWVNVCQTADMIFYGKVHIFDETIRIL